MARSPAQNDLPYSQVPVEDYTAQNENHRRRPQLNETIASRESNIPDTILLDISEHGNVNDEDSVERAPEPVVGRAVVFDQTACNDFSLVGSVCRELLAQLENMEHDFILRNLPENDLETPDSIRVHDSSAPSSLESSIHHVPLMNDMYPPNYNECVYAGSWMDETPPTEASEGRKEKRTKATTSNMLIGPTSQPARCRDT